MAEHIYHLGTSLETVGSIEVYLQSALLSLLGGNDDNTIRCTGTIDGSRRSILQHCHALNISRVDHTEEVAGITRDATLFQWYTIEYDKRVITCIERSTSTHTNGTTSRSRTTVRHDLHTRNLTINQLFW